MNGCLINTCFYLANGGEDMLEIERVLKIFATLKEVQNDEWTFGEATKDVLNLKPLESLEDSICIYIRVK